MKLFTLLISIISCSIVFAATGEDADTNVGGTGQYTDVPGVPGNTTAQGGNVTRTDLSSNTSTTKWQGFFGNVSGNLVLGLGTDALYDFGSADITAVYAARDANFDFANIEFTIISQVDTAFGFNTAADVDQAADVFTGTLTIDGITNAPSTTLDDGNFQCYVADDGNNAAVGDFVFGGEVQNAGALGFDGNTWQYELMVPIDAGTPSYYFFMTL